MDNISRSIDSEHITYAGVVFRDTVRTTLAYSDPNGIDVMVA